MRLSKKLFGDFVHFSQRQYDSLDYDPFHPMLVELQKGLPDEEALWHSTLYLAFYNIGSSEVAFETAPRLKARVPDWLGHIPVGVQRRNLRGGKVLTHLQSFCKLVGEVGSIRAYLTQGFEGDPKQDWFKLQANVGRAWGNGRWAIYTQSELYQKVNGIPVWPCDLMNEDSSGPRSGLSKLWGLDVHNDETETFNEAGDKLYWLAAKQVNTKIPYLPAGHYDYAMLESQLCDFNSMMKGRYYVGRDIDRDQERIRKTDAALKLLRRPRKALDKVREARLKAFEPRYLGEINGWLGRTKYALTHYQLTGEVADHFTIREKRPDVLF